MAYKIISLVDGSTKSCDLVNLSQSLSLNCEVLREVDGSHEAVGFVSHETLVFFAVEFADYALKNYTQQKSQEAEACIALTRQRLKNHDSVSNKELRAAVYAADDAAHAAYAAHAANGAAANAAAYAAHATYDAANPAYAAAHAANAAAYAAYAYAGKNREAELIRQGQCIVEYMRAV